MEHHEQPRPAIVGEGVGTAVTVGQPKRNRRVSGPLHRFKLYSAPMTFVAALEPTPLWQHFDTILTIPRGSGNEARMRQHVTDVADRAGLDYQTDRVGNIVVRKPGTPATTTTTILQSHLDMVNEKNSDHPHDFLVDPIVPALNDARTHLTADGTTLGSDNGIGVAAMLAVMEATDLVHGPLEFLFTVDEETGLTGAGGLDPTLLTGRQLLNLDSEEEGILCVGCAGGGDSQLRLRLALGPLDKGEVTVPIALTGLKGGHSGCEIHLQRGNAVKLLARALAAVPDTTPFRLSRFEGGRAHNAIPREAFATVVVSADGKDSFLAALRAEGDAIRREYHAADPGMTFGVVRPSSAPSAAGHPAAWTREMTDAAIWLLEALPHGVEAMSHDVEGLVETSSNVATVVADGDHLRVGVSTRSSTGSALEALRRRVRAIGHLAGADVEEDVAYPGWQPDLSSPLLGVVKAAHERVFGRLPEVAAIHAGLECGIIGKMVPGMDMISFGPIIEFPHSPDERVEIGSVGRFYQLLTATLEAVACAPAVTGRARGGESDGGVSRGAGESRGSGPA